VRRRAAGLLDIRDAPAFADWAGVYYEYKSASRFKVKRPEQIAVLVRVALRFWGRRPTKPEDVVAGEPYHDLTLGDPVLEPEWLLRFDQWMDQHRFSASHRNHLRTQISGMYKVAALPEYRKRTGVEPHVHPMMGVPRDRQRPRDVTLTPAQVTAWIAHASYHIRLAIAIAALAPKLRLSNILALEWERHLDASLTRLTVEDHKTDRRTGRPLVVMISTQLRDILDDARTRRTSRFVVSYHHDGVRWIRGGVRQAAARANIPYGRHRPDGREIVARGESCSEGHYPRGAKFTWSSPAWIVS
jgi:hypothetical protein